MTEKILLQPGIRRSRQKALSSLAEIKQGG